MMANSLIVLGQPRFMEERQWFRREYASRYYGWAPFGKWLGSFKQDKVLTGTISL
jgi:hypothetical protein